MRRMKRVLPLLLVLALAPTAVAGEVYLRGGVGFERTEATTLRDRDCTSTQPPALFGCGDGIDGRPLGARGDFGDSPAWELAIGTHLGTRTRAELAFTARPLDLDAEADFVGVSGEQPVTADGQAYSLLASGYLDLGPETWRVRPFVTAGAGIARISVDDVTYGFPGIAPNAVTITRGGSHDGLAWTVGAGTSVRLTPRLDLDLTLRYTDLGELRTAAGAATIVRPTRTFTIDIDGTRADVRSIGAVVSLRYRL
jgi:opacity protein-like surface antigen